MTQEDLCDEKRGVKLSRMVVQHLANDQHVAVVAPRSAQGSKGHEGRYSEDSERRQLRRPKDEGKTLCERAAVRNIAIVRIAVETPAAMTKRDMISPGLLRRKDP